MHQTPDEGLRRIVDSLVSSIAELTKRVDALLLRLDTLESSLPNRVELVIVNQRQQKELADYRAMKSTIRRVAYTVGVGAIGTVTAILISGWLR